MNYKEQIPYNTPTKYSSLQDTTNYDCDQTCLCRSTEERSDKDKMYYDWFVLDKPMIVPTNEGKDASQMTRKSN